MPGFNTYPAMQIQSIDLGRVLSQAEAIKTAKTRNALLERSMAQQDELTSLRKQMANPEPSQDQVTNALVAGGGPTPTAEAALDKSQAATQNDLLRRYIALDPQGGSQMLAALGNMDDRQREAMKQANDITAKLLVSVEQSQDKESAYQAALQEAKRMGIPTDAAPKTYDPQWARMQIMKARAIEDALKTQKPVSVAPGNALVSPTGKELYVNQKGQDPAKDPARIREARYLVDAGVFKTFEEAYKATRTRVSMDPQTLRTKALTWVSAQKDRHGRPKYTTPEQQNAAYQAYMLWAGNKPEEAVTALQKLEPKKPKTEQGIVDQATEWLKSLWRSSGSEGTETDGGQPETQAGPRSSQKPFAPAPERTKPPTSETKPQGKAALPDGTEIDLSTAQKAPDGNWYVEHKGKFYKVNP